MKKFNGKAIYNPAGKAGEYSYWACNFHTGCSNGCTYCYLGKGLLAHAMGGNVPVLKKCFKDETDALVTFEKELMANLTELKEHGLFFTFTTDPMLESISHIYWAAIMKCNENGVPVKVLTKCAGWVKDTLDWLDRSNSDNADREWRKTIAFGFTLTGHDELEPNASTNAERIEGMRLLRAAGFKTFASIEPVIDFNSSRKMIEETLPFCDLYKIGLESGKKYPIKNIHLFLHQVSIMTRAWKNKIYFKDGLIAQAKTNRANLPDNCVTRDYNLFTKNQEN